MSRKRRDPYNQRDRRPKERFAALSHDLIDSEAFRHLSGAAVKLLILVHRRYNGFNNGRIAVAQTEAARFLHLGKDTIGDAFAELQAHGFVQLIHKGRRGGQRLASEWALTSRQLDIKLPAGFEHRVGAWRHWRPTPMSLKADSHGPEARTCEASHVPVSGPWHQSHVPASGTVVPDSCCSHVPASGAHIYTMGIAAAGGGPAEAFASAGRDRRRAGEPLPPDQTAVQRRRAAFGRRATNESVPQPNRETAMKHRGDKLTGELALITPIKAAPPPPPSPRPPKAAAKRRAARRRKAKYQRKRAPA
jgi:hypothetical protein